MTCHAPATHVATIVVARSIVFCRNTCRPGSFPAQKRCMRLRDNALPRPALTAYHSRIAQMNPISNLEALFVSGSGETRSPDGITGSGPCPKLLGRTGAQGARGSGYAWVRVKRAVQSAGAGRIPVGACRLGWAKTNMAFQMRRNRILVVVCWHLKKCVRCQQTKNQYHRVPAKRRCCLPGLRKWGGVAMGMQVPYQ